MTSIEPNSTAPLPEPPWFQFGLRTLLLVAVVLASSLAVFGTWGIVAFVIVLGLALYVRKVGSWERVGRVVTGVVCLVCFVALLKQVTEGILESALRTVCVNNLKRIALALQAYHAAHGCFPPAYVADQNGKPMHSWRTLILPYLDMDDQYKMYKLTEPWDGPNNKRLSAAYISAYICPSEHRSNWPNRFETNYVAVVGSNAAWGGDKPAKLTDFGPNPADTIMVIEMAHSGIAWSEPRDLPLDSLAAVDGKPVMESSHFPRRDFFSTYEDDSCLHALFADGSVRYIRLNNQSNGDLLKMLQIGGAPKFRIGKDGGTAGPNLNWPNIAALAVWLVSIGLLLAHAAHSRRPNRVTRLTIVSLASYNNGNKPDDSRLESSHESRGTK